MASKHIKNVEASIRARLLNYAKNKNENYNSVLIQFFNERFLARLGASKYKQYFVLKGGIFIIDASY